MSKAQVQAILNTQANGQTDPANVVSNIKTELEKINLTIDSATALSNEFSTLVLYVVNKNADAEQQAYGQEEYNAAGQLEIKLVWDGSTVSSKLI